MKNVISLLSFVLLVQVSMAQLKAPGVKWDESYKFDKANKLKIDFYDKKGKLMQTANYQTHYQSDGKNFDVRLVASNKNMNMETVFDLTNEVCIQVFGDKSMYNAGRFKYPEAADLKKLDLVETSETKDILGHKCKKYTYTFKKIFGEVWITDEITLSNDYGIFRAAKMAAKHNTLSVGGFVMEMTTEDSTGAKTVMSTVSLENNEGYTVSFKGVDMNTAINKVNYYTF
jgi:hypothetical protein